MLWGGWPTRSYGSVSREIRGIGAFAVEAKEGTDLKHWLCDLAPSAVMNAINASVRSCRVDKCRTISLEIPHSVLYVPPFNTWAYCKNFRR